MIIGMISCLEKGEEIKSQLLWRLGRQGHEVFWWACEGEYDRISMSSWVKEHFEEYDGFIFIGDCDTALRCVCPLIHNKSEDPAVLVIDKDGHYVLSLLSGHLGGANDLTKYIADMIDAVPVITTATDLGNKFAVDNFAKRNNCGLSSLAMAKEISAALVNGSTVGFKSDIPYTGDLPEGLIVDKPYDLGIYVTTSSMFQPFHHTLYVVPKVITLGVGCRKGTTCDVIKKVVEKFCRMYNIPLEGIEQVASIDLKSHEKGLLDFCNDTGLPFITFSKEELEKLPGKFTPSPFVLKVTGVDNVCERSALLASSRKGAGSRITVRKFAEEGVTVAEAVRKWSVDFE